MVILSAVWFSFKKSPVLFLYYETTTTTKANNYKWIRPINATSTGHIHRTNQWYLEVRHLNTDKQWHAHIKHEYTKQSQILLLFKQSNSLTSPCGVDYPMLGCFPEVNLDARHLALSTHILLYSLAQRHPQVKTPRICITNQIFAIYYKRFFLF